MLCCRTTFPTYAAAGSQVRFDYVLCCITVVGDVSNGTQKKHVSLVVSAKDVLHNMAATYVRTIAAVWSTELGPTHTYTHTHTHTHTHAYTGCILFTNDLTCKRLHTINTRKSSHTCYHHNIMCIRGRFAISIHSPTERQTQISYVYHLSFSDSEAAKALQYYVRYKYSYLAQPHLCWKVKIRNPKILEMKQLHFFVSALCFSVPSFTLFMSGLVRGLH